MNSDVIEVADKPVKEWSFVRLSNEAGLMAGPEKDSEGAAFLEIVRDTLIEHVDMNREAASHEYEEYFFDLLQDQSFDIIHNAVDGCVPIYTYKIWLTFVSLGAWAEDLAELGGPETDMTKNAMTAIYMIGCRLGDSVMNTYRKELMNATN
tara:strand:- start:1647 stop:2099 length:453 start_codon:yes stop_codon:yes gene_type:complete